MRARVTVSATRVSGARRFSGVAMDNLSSIAKALPKSRLFQGAARNTLSPIERVWRRGGFFRGAPPIPPIGLAGEKIGSDQEHPRPHNLVGASPAAKGRRGLDRLYFFLSGTGGRDDRAWR